MIKKYKEFLKESEDLEQPILDLFLTCDNDNIDLAFTIMKGQKIKVGYFLSKYFGKLFKFFKIKETKEGVKHLFSMVSSGDNTVGNIIPDNLHYLKNLKRLNLTYKDLTEIPLSVCNIPNLEHLDLENNKISEIPKEINNLKHLKYLDLENNKLVNIDNINKLYSLENLILSRNKLNKISDVITKLTNLQKLHIESNNISEIPKEIGNLINLKSLDLSNNNITILPDTLTNLQKLEHLFLQYNKKLSLEDSNCLGSLVNLKKINLNVTNTKYLVIDDLRKKLINTSVIWGTIKWK